METAARIGQEADTEAALIPVEDIIAHEQVRRKFDDSAIGKLADSLELLGQQQAITVYYDKASGRFVIIHGERRVRAARRLGWGHIRAWIRAKAPSEDQRIELQLAENVARADLNDIEIAEALAALRKLRGYSTRELANRVGKSQTSVIRLLSFLALPQDLKQHVADGTLPASVAYEIGKIPSRSVQRQAAKRYLRGELTRAGVEEYSRVLSITKNTARAKERSRNGAYRHSPWPVRLDGGNGLRVSVKPMKNSSEAAWTFEHVKEALKEALAEVNAWVEGQVKLI
jgi:ParB/RepB/Spo0J family partition protein